MRPPCTRDWRNMHSIEKKMFETQREINISHTHAIKRGRGGVSEDVSISKPGPSFDLAIHLTITSGQSNLTKGRIAAAHEGFNRIRQVALMCTPI